MFARMCFVFAVALVAVAPVFADDVKAVEIRPKWKKGDLFRYEMTRTKAHEVNEKVVQKITVRTPVEVEVIATDEEGSFLRWTQGSTVFDDPKLDTDPLARTINSIMKGLDIDLELDADGMFLGIRNWKELRGSGHKVQDAVLAQLAKTGTPKSTIDALRKQTDKLFETQESIETAFGRQPALLFFPFGQEYEVNKPIFYEAQIPNVFGGEEPFPAIGECTLKSVNKETGIAMIVFKQTLDPKQTERVLRKWLDDLAKKTGTPAPRELPAIQIDDVMEYEFDLIAGLVKSVTHTRTAKHPTGTQIETVTLTRKAR